MAKLTEDNPVKMGFLSGIKSMRRRKVLKFILDFYAAIFLCACNFARGFRCGFYRSWRSSILRHCHVCLKKFFCLSCCFTCYHW